MLMGLDASCIASVGMACGFETSRSKLGEISAEAVNTGNVILVQAIADVWYTTKYVN